MNFRPLVLNFLCSTGDHEDFGKSFHDIILQKEDMVYPEDLKKDSTLAEKIVGAYVSSSCTPSDPVPQDFLEKLPNLKSVIFLGIGINRISLKWAKNKGLRIGHTGNEVSADTADIAVIHMAVTARNFLQSKYHISHHILILFNFIIKTIKKNQKVKLVISRFLIR